MQNIAPSQASAEVPINENFQTLIHQEVYGKKQSTTTGLTWGYWGGRWAGFLIADGTLALTASATNYIVVLRSTGVISVSTAVTNWNDANNYQRVYKLTTSATAVTATEDHRAGQGGVHGGQGIASSDEFVNAQTGTAYSYVTADKGKLVTHSNAGAIAGTLPQAGASFPSGWWVDVQNRGAGTLTITPTTSTVDGAASLVLTTGQGVRLASDGVNYFTQRGKASGIAASDVSNTPAGGVTELDVQGATNGLEARKSTYHINDIINGDFRIAQAGTSFAAPAHGAYDLDGWLHGTASGAVVTVAQVAGSTPGRLARQVTITTADATVAAGDFLTDITKIEGYNIEKYVGNTFTVAFRAKVPSVGIHCVALRNSAGDRSYIREINFPTANVWQDCSFTVAGGLPTAGTWNYTNGSGLELWFAHMVGTTYQTTPDAWNTGSFLGTANQVNDCATVGNVWALEKVTMNLGTVAAVSEIDVGSELIRAMRYHEVTPTGLTGCTLFIAISVANTQGLNFKVSKRAPPTVQLISRNGTVGKVSSAASGLDVGATATANNISATGFHNIGDTSNPFTAGQGYDCSYIASARL